MKTVDIGEVASLLEKYDNSDRPLILTRNGQPVTALFPIGDLHAKRNRDRICSLTIQYR